MARSLSPDSILPEKAKDVLYFWFEESSKAQWFQKDDAFDEEIRRRFSKIHESARRGETKNWRETCEGRLAEIIVLDQFSRNLFRNDPRAFQNDTAALELAQEAMEAACAKNFSDEKRHFLYMPLMHSESAEVHKKALELFETLGGKALEAEKEHKKIIDRFGRYPHRNEILGRVSTKEEREFLETHDGF